MTDSTSVNVDNSVIVNFLYSTVLAEKTDEEAVFEPDKGCKEYFECENIYIVAGGNADDEFENLCERRKVLYRNIGDFLTETGKSIFEYEFGWDDEKNNINDEGHLREVKMSMHMHESSAEQYSVMRRVIQQLGECKRQILANDIDETFDEFTDNGFRRKINRRLSINHDADIIVDAAYIELNHGVRILAAKDSDITDNSHQAIINEIIEEKLDDSVELEIINPEETTPDELLN
jgi:hypothetical protein